MKSIKNKLEKLPEFESREKALQMLKNELFGDLSDTIKIVANETVSKNREYIQNAIWEKVRLTASAKKGEFSFDVDFAYPENAKNLPVFLHISFKTFEDSEKEITQTVIDSNAMFVNVYYKNITEDDNDFESGICAILDEDYNASNRPGKISIWANTLIAIIDLLTNNEIVNKDKICVVGHSRLGKTALWAGALDERVYLTVSNNSGASGAALARDNTGEKVADITSNFPFWFANNYKKYSENEEKMPFDQHFLLSLIAPRKLYVSSASLDEWACPKNEFLCAVKTSEAYENLGLTGIVIEDEFKFEAFECNKGNIGYHMREGVHQLTNYDWKKFVAFI